MLVDPHGRTVRDLRISITDRCNFRCQYCMPAEGMQWVPRDEVLTFEEIERIAKLCVERYGFTSIRLTGGEPTVRSHLPVLIEKLSALGIDLAMTTNGATLGLMAGDLRAAGLHRINISLDSLRPERFAEITRRDRLDQVLEGIDAAVEAGFDPVKVNCVLMRGVNDDELVDFARFGRDRGVAVRFIEFMPLDADEQWGSHRVVPSSEVVAAIDAVFPLVPAPPAERGSAPASVWRYADGQGDVGVIGSVTQPFCGDCDRVRLTADGQVRNCLFAREESDLRGALRAGASDEELADRWRTAMLGKRPGHGIDDVSFLQPSRPMSAIGG